MKVLVKIPSRGRGLNWLHQWTNNAMLQNTRFIVSLDRDDPTVQTEFPWLRFERRATVIKGDSLNKIHAINRDIETAGDWDFIIVGSDDMVPLMNGYDKFVADNCPRDGVLWLPTEDSTPHIRGGHRMIPGSKGYLYNWISMLPIMGREYYDRFGYVYHPDYQGFWCDNEFTRVAQRLGKMTFINDPHVFKHNHPDWGGTQERDETYAKYDLPMFRSDMQVYKRREAHNFGL